jgi:modified peptide precursor CbpA
MKTSSKKEAVRKVVSFRKCCEATGVGLSHYILIGRDAEEKE